MPFFRSTACISFRFRRGRDRSDKSSALSLHRGLSQARILIRSCYLGYLLTLCLLLHTDMKQNSYRFFLDACRHGREHFIAAQLILYERISLRKRLQANTLTKLIHIVDMIHPLPVDDLQKEYALQLTEHLRIREFRLLHLVKLHCLFLQHMLQFILILLISNALLRHRFQRNRPEQGLIQSQQIPVCLVLIVPNQAVYYIFHCIGQHLVNRIAHTLAVQNTASLPHR